MGWGWVWYRPWGRLIHADGVIGVESREGGFYNAAHPKMDPLIKGKVGGRESCRL